MYEDTGVIVEKPTPKETEAARAKFNELYKWARSLTTEQIDFLCNGGWYNNTIKGYLILACKNADMPREQIEDLLYRLNWAFDDHNKADADKAYNKF